GQGELAPCQFYFKSNGVLTFAASERIRTINSFIGIELSEYRFVVYELFIDATSIGPPVEVNKSLFIPGAYPAVHDGSLMTEASFIETPIILAAAEANFGFPAVGDGTYSYVAVWEWFDSQGNFFRSAPSTPKQVTVTGGPNYGVNIA